MPATLLKVTRTQVFSNEFCKTFKNNYVVKHQRTDVAVFFYSVNTFDVTRFYDILAEDMVEPYFKDILLKRALFLF